VTSFLILFLKDNSGFKGYKDKNNWRSWKDSGADQMSFSADTGKVPIQTSGWCWVVMMMFYQSTSKGRHDLSVN
jgi:hypothetical protein